MESARNSANRPVITEPNSYTAMNKAFKVYYGNLTAIKTQKPPNLHNKTDEVFNIISKPGKKVNQNESYCSLRKIEKIVSKYQTSSTVASPRKETGPTKRAFRSVNSSFTIDEKLSQSMDVRGKEIKRPLSVIHSRSVPKRENPEPKEEKKEVVRQKSPKGEVIRPYTSKPRQPIEERKMGYIRGFTNKEVKQEEVVLTAEDKKKIAVHFRYRICTLNKLIDEKVLGKCPVVKTDRPATQASMQRPAFGGYKPMINPGKLPMTKDSGSIDVNKTIDQAWSILKAKASARSKFKYKGITNYSKTITELMKSILPADSAQSPKKPLSISLTDKDPSKKKVKKPKSPKEGLVANFNESVHMSSRKVFIVIGGYPRVKKALRERGWIENPDKTSKNFDLKWGSRIDMDTWSLQPHQLVNHCEKSISITSKLELAWNMRNLIWQGEDIDEYYPRCYDLSDLNELDDFLEDYKFEQAVAMVRLAKKNSSSGVESSLSRMKLCVAIGYCERRLRDLEGVVCGVVKSEKQLMGQEEWEILNANSIKTVLNNMKYANLVDSIKRRYRVDFETEARPIETEENICSTAEKIMSRLEESFPQVAMNQGKNAWIVKPGGLSRGRGISCHNLLGNILEHIKTRGSDWIAQKYIENPLVIKNRKFDIRQWVLVTDWNPLTVWFYDECYLRFTAQDFNPDDLNNKFAHLTNNAIAKHASNFENSCIEGNMWDSNQLKDYLQETTSNDTYEEKIKPQMKNIVIKSLQCSQDTPELRKNTFELYGYDFMVDQDFKVWLIEVNSSPCMEYSTKVTERLVKMVLEDCIKVVVDYGMADPKDRKGIDTGCFKRIFKEKRREIIPMKHTRASKFY